MTALNKGEPERESFPGKDDPKIWILKEIMHMLEELKVKIEKEGFSIDVDEDQVFERAYDIAGFVTVDSGWTSVSLDECQWRTIHASNLSEVEIKVVRQKVELEVDGRDLGEIVGTVSASGVVRIHGKTDGAVVKYRKGE